MADIDVEWDDQDGEETSSEKVSSEDVTRAVVTDTDWTSETILSQLRRGNILLNPRFQRRDAWDRPRKSKFIESLILGLPIPQIVLAEDKNRRGKFIVIDGKQRLLALRQFAVGSSLASPDGDDFKALSLSGLEVREDLRLGTLKKFENDSKYIDDLNAFLNETIRTVVIRRWPDEEFLNLVFLRLNTGSVKLSPQELRQALHPGDFTDYLDDRASSSEWLQKALRLQKPDFRMRDVEVMLRFYAFYFRIEEYTGNLKKFLDDTVDFMNNLWGEDPERIEDAAVQCEKAIEATFSVFDDNSFYRWSNGRYEGRFNRAVFDIMTFYFSRPEIREMLAGAETSVQEAFQLLCDQDTEFVESIQTTTKTPEATYRRLSTWGTTLATTLNAQISLPDLRDNRIVL